MIFPLRTSPFPSADLFFSICFRQPSALSFLLLFDPEYSPEKWRNYTRGFHNDYLHRHTSLPIYCRESHLFNSKNPATLSAIASANAKINPGSRYDISIPSPKAAQPRPITRRSFLLHIGALSFSRTCIHSICGVRGGC